MANTVKIAQIQTKVFAEKEKNIEQAKAVMAEACQSRPDFVTFGEMFTCPYQTENFPVYAEPDKGASWHEFSDMAREHSVYFLPGSIPVKDEEGRVFNTSYVFDRNGNEIARHDKVHLFDINFTNGGGFKESETLTAGNHATTFDTEFGTMGIMICFDIRFVELARLMALDGARIIFVPACFNMTTGPAHWELSYRMRAVDNQCYMVGTSVARDESVGYIAFGNSMVTSPWGEVVGRMDEKPGYNITEIDLDYIDKIRYKLPIMDARRTDLYEMKKI